ncbi:MAG: 50S ribosomal protein L17 [Candidatus Omnitrophica bacterium]|nr:50S ribosomal protein L17 [Candidatus Omnitrophota bacterium]
MRHGRLRRKLGVKSQHRKALLRNLVQSLVIHKRIFTTVAKAKEASAFADQMVTLAKRGGLSSHRLLISRLGSQQAAKTLITQIAPAFKDRQGGYTRVLKVGFRPGDAADTALLEFSTFIESPEKKKAQKPKKEGKIKETEAPQKVKEKKVEHIHEEKKHPSREEKAEAPKKAEKKESEKKGGFLNTLRKFLKGDEDKKS